MEVFRKIEPDRPVICLFEDIDAIIEIHGDSELLQWLDGSHQIKQGYQHRHHELSRTARPPHRVEAAPFDRIIKIEFADRVDPRDLLFARNSPTWRPTANSPTGSR